MIKNQSLPLFAQGRARLKTAFQASLTASKNTHLDGEHFDSLQSWSDAYLCLQGPACTHAESLEDFGYTESPSALAEAKGLTAYAEVNRLFTDQGVAALRSACEQLEGVAGHSQWIISKRCRAATEHSTLVREMMNSRAFLLAVSRVAGVPLIPYPMISARSQVNYYSPAILEDELTQFGMWHTDGTRFVLNILLSDPDEYRGGEFVFHHGTTNSFDINDYAGNFRKSRVSRCGDAVYLFGSQVFHGVKPVISGKRMALVLSFHCPYSREDANTFWHLSSDDGIGATIMPWLKLQRDLRRSATEQYRRLGIDPISFGEVLFGREAVLNDMKASQ